MTLQEIIFSLQRFWSERGCLIHQPWDVEVGAGTMHPETFFRVLGPRPWRVGYVQPSRRPADGRYGENPNRLYKHQQFQVILKPPPADIQDAYFASLTALGIDPAVHDVRFEEDNWESPTLGAWGIGWQVLLDGIASLSFLKHFADISKGVIDLRDLVYFVLMTGFWLVANVLVITGGPGTGFLTVLPMMLGAKDVALPRLNLASFWLWITGALVLSTGMVLGALLSRLSSRRHRQRLRL